MAKQNVGRASGGAGGDELPPVGLEKEKVFVVDREGVRPLLNEYKHIDPIMFQVISNGLISICREMGTTMMRTAYSPIFVDGLDFSCGILDGNAKMAAQAEYCPVHLNSMAYAGAWAMMEVGYENVGPGDVFMHNDPYRGGTHLNDFNVMKPVFYDGELLAIACNRAHQVDIGGRARAGFPGDANEIYQEGLNFPPVRWYKAGVEQRDIFNILLENVRQPYIQMGDFTAQLASCITAERRIQAFCVRYGVEAVKECFAALQDYSERRMRAAISEMPDGVYEFTDFADNDGINVDPIMVKVKITISGDDIIFDFTGSSPQVEGPMNATYGICSSSVCNSLLQVSDPHIPVNGGALRPITIIAPRGSVINAETPAPTMGGNTDLSIRIIETCLGAFAQALPDRVIAATYGTTNNFTGGCTDPETGFRWLWYLFNEGGWGARPSKDGWTEIYQATGNCNDYPTEILEAKFPIFVHSLRLSENLEGAGTFRGGYGLTKEYEFLMDSEVNLIGERHRFAPWGLRGGHPASCNAVLYRAKGGEEFKTFVEAFNTKSASKFGNIATKAGDHFKLVHAGGGGFGNPLGRDCNAVLRDVEDELVSVERAREVYGVVIEESDEGSGYRQNMEATVALRESRAGEEHPNKVANGVVTVSDEQMRALGMGLPPHPTSRTDRIVDHARSEVDESICHSKCVKAANGLRCPYWSDEAMKFWGSYVLAMWTKDQCPQATTLLPLFEYKRIY